MKKKYYNEAFIGNKDITASFSKYGELLRLYYPLRDYRQYSEYFYVGLKINDSNIIYLHNDINNHYKQYYTDKTNILNTEILNDYFNIRIKQTDAVMINKDVMLKKYEFKNENTIDLNVNLLIHSKAVSSFNNMVGSLILNDSLVQYSHNFTSAIFSKEPLYSHQLNNTDSNINSGMIYDKDYIGMSSDSAISYNLGTIKPNETRGFSLFIYMQYDVDRDIPTVEEKIEELRKLSIDKELIKIKNSWERFFDEHDTLKLKSDGSNFQNEILKIYKRTILYLPLLMNTKTGGITASLEVDEERDKSGRYSYCWPRDAALIYNSMNRLNFDDNCKKFYEVFLKRTQASNGMWEQRFYTDGRLAPCWGYQVDETATAVWEAYQFYKTEGKIKGKKQTKFLRDNLKMLERAIDFLEKYTDFVLGKEEKEDRVKADLEKSYNTKNKDEIYKHSSYDLWEMNEGVHLYSLSAIYGAFNAMIKIYDEISDSFTNNRLKVDAIIQSKKKMKEEMDDIKSYILKNLYDDKKKVLVRNESDRLTDISIMGAIIPFEVFSPDEKIVKNTVDQINMTLRTYLGGYLRFQNDTYIGGNNPWIISTCWMGLYYAKIGNIREATKCLKFVVNSATELGLLAEQANSDLNEKWVIGLGWSHAMFIELLNTLYKKNKNLKDL